MMARDRGTRNFTFLLKCLTFAIVYIAAGKFGLWLSAAGGGYAAPVWPPTGIALMVLLRWGIQYCPGILIGAFVVNFSVSGDMTFVNILGSAFISLGNMLEAVVAVLILNKYFRFSHTYSRLSDGTGFIIAASLGGWISATMGTMSLIFMGLNPTWSEFVQTWVIWWTGDTLGALVITPILLTIQNRDESRIVRLKPSVDIVYLSLIALVCAFSLGGIIPPEVKNFAAAFIAFSFLIWAALRYPMRGLSLAIAALAAISIFSAYNGLAPFASVHNTVQRLFLLQFFLGCSSISMIVLNIIFTERLSALDLVRKSEAALIQKERMTALGEMSGGLAHEINNPLAIIFGKAEILKELVVERNLDPANVESIAEKIRINALRISRIIKALRLFATDPGDDPYEFVPVGSLIEEAAELCRERFYTNKIDLMIDPVSSSLKIQCRPAQIIQLLLNLLNNSCDACSSLDQKWVRISVQPKTGRVLIVVSDSGSGIPSKNYSRVFQPFFTTKEIGKGTGLGLSISKGIAESHQGHLTLDSEAKHTTFLIELPLYQTKVVGEEGRVLRATVLSDP